MSMTPAEPRHHDPVRTTSHEGESEISAERRLAGAVGASENGSPAPNERRRNWLAGIPLFVAFAVTVGALIFASTRTIGRPHTHNPYESGQIVEAWRTIAGLPVYEDPSVGHATHMYGALAPYVLGAVYRVTGVNLWAGR